MDTTRLTAAIQKILFDPMVGKIITILLGLAVILFLAQVVKGTVRRHVADTQNRYRLAKLVSFSSYFLMVVLLTVVFSDKLGGLTTALGLAGAGVAFALQAVISSIAGWIAISAGGYYHTGDRVKVGGITGDVIDISILRTTVMELGEWVDGDLYNGRIVRVANSNVFTGPVYNYSADFPFVWDELKVPVRYGSDLALAEKIVGEYGREAANSWKEVAQKYMVEDANTSPMVTLVATDNWCDYTLRYTVDYSKRRTTKHKLFRRLVEQIVATGGAVQLASGTYEIVAAPRFDVHVDNS